MKPFHLEIITPEARAFEGDVVSAVFPGAAGEFAIMYDHAPLLSLLKPGEIRITKESGVQTLAISGGFLEVKQNKVSVVTEVVDADK